MVPLSKESLASCFLYSSYRLFDSYDVVVVCHDQVRRQVSQGFRCHDIGCVVQSNRCLTSCGEAPQSVHVSLGSPNSYTLCL